MIKLKKTGYIAGLDGWRALSVLGVLAAHSHAFSIGGHKVAFPEGPGLLGVYIFFNISGLLICMRILEEEDVLGRVNLKGFYIRRIFRLQPAALVYLAAVALLILAGCVAQSWKFWFGALFSYTIYLGNFSPAHPHEGLLVAPFWTLAVEEHFYLILSLLLFFVRRRRLLLMTILYLASLAWTIYCFLHWPALLNKQVFQSILLQLQFLMPASMFAILLRRPAFARRALHWLRPWLVIWVPFGCAVAAVALLKFGGARMGSHSVTPHLLVRNMVWVSIELCVFWIVATTLHPQSLTTRLLELPPLRWLGRISYSLYLWHAISFFSPVVAIGSRSTKFFVFLNHTPIMLTAAFACACASFYLVERPMMRLGHRLAPPATPGRSDMQNEPSIEAAIEANSPA